MIKKQRFVPQLGNIEPATDNFEELLQSVDTSSIKEGSVVRGEVVGYSNGVIIVDVGLKNECRIPESEFKVSDDYEKPAIGSIVDVYVEKIEGRRGTLLSREKAIREESWANLEQMHEDGENVIGTIFGRVKGGFTVDIKGVIAFLPGSQVDVRPIKDPTSIMNIEQPFQILKMDKKLGNIVVSRRAILEESRSEARDEMLAQIKEGMKVKGIVKNITDYGAFIDLGSVDGLLHVTDISWSRINHPSEVLSFGQEIEVVIIQFNEETKRISLGMKQLQQNPWSALLSEFPVNKRMKGKITNIADYGAFVELKEGVEGLVHSSEISWGKNNQNPKKTLTIGQEVEFLILDVDTEKNRISLSMKRCQTNPIIEFAEKYPVGSIFKTKVTNVTEFALFVEISKDVDGMIHSSDISWDGQAVKHLANYKKGDEVECKVLAIKDDQKVALGIKQLTEDPNAGAFEGINRNAIVTSIVSEIKEDGIEVIINDGARGFIKKNDLSSERAEQKPSRFARDDRVDAKVISVDKATGIVNLSIRALELDQRDKAIKEYGSTDSGASLGDILGAALNEQKDSKK